MRFGEKNVPREGWGWEGQVVLVFLPLLIQLATQAKPCVRKKKAPTDSFP